MPASMESAPSSALAICVALPKNVNVLSLVAASSAPGRLAIWPFGKSGHKWKPKMRSTWYFSNTPDSQMNCAPPVVSSAGWNTMSTLRSSLSRFAAIWRARPSAMAMCPSWPQACICPSCVEQNGTPDFSVTGSASISVRMAVACSLPRSNHAHTVEAHGSNTSHGSLSIIECTYAMVFGKSKSTSGIWCRSRRYCVRSASVGSANTPLQGSHSFIVPLRLKVP